MNEKSGSRRWAIRMEYVVIAVLVVAAIILAVLYFGRSVVNSVGVAGDAMTGAPADACQRQSAQESGARCKAAESANKFADPQERKAAETSVRSAEVDIPLSDDDRGRGRKDVK